MARGSSEKRAVGAVDLLSRGGRILGLAAVAHARGQRSGEGPWHVLPPDTVAAAEALIARLERQPDPALLEAAVCSAMGPDPATRPPSWAKALVEEPGRLERIGSAIDAGDLAPALGPHPAPQSARGRGLAALAVGLCRGLDGLRALSAALPEDEGRALVRMGHLAQLLAEPGEPSRMRRRIRELSGKGAGRG